MSAESSAISPARSGSRSSLREKLRKVSSVGLQAFIGFLAIAVLAQNVVLRGQNKRFKELQSTMVPRSLLPQTGSPTIEVGRRVPSIGGITPDGKFRDMRLASNQPFGTLVITFSSGCPSCLHNQEGWQALASSLKSKGWHVVWVSRDAIVPTRKYSVLHAVDLADVVADPPMRTYTQLALAAVPNTVVFDANGTVRQVWRGELKDQWGKVFEYFQLSTPSFVSSDNSDGQAAPKRSYAEPKGSN